MGCHWRDTGKSSLHCSVVFCSWMCRFIGFKKSELLTNSEGKNLLHWRVWIVRVYSTPNSTMWYFGFGDNISSSIANKWELLAYCWWNEAFKTKRQQKCRVKFLQDNHSISRRVLKQDDLTKNYISIPLQRFNITFAFWGIGFWHSYLLTKYEMCKRITKWVQ